MRALLIFSMLFVSAASAEERSVIVPLDNKPFTVKEDQFVRLVGKGIAGSKISATVTGSAKIETTNAIRQVGGGKTLIGVNVKEFDLKPTGKGKVTVLIIVAPPQPDSKPIETKYQFEVE